MHTAAFEVPAGSPVARLAHQANTTATVTLIGERLRGAIAEAAPQTDRAASPRQQGRHAPLRPAWPE